jgi:hypothetical protein
MEVVVAYFEADLFSQHLPRGTQGDQENRRSG